MGNHWWRMKFRALRTWAKLTVLVEQLANSQPKSINSLAHWLKLQLNSIDHIRLIRMEAIYNEVRSISLLAITATAKLNGAETKESTYSSRMCSLHIRNHPFKTFATNYLVSTNWKHRMLFVVCLCNATTEFRIPVNQALNRFCLHHPSFSLSPLLAPFVGFVCAQSLLHIKNRKSSVLMCQLIETLWSADSRRLMSSHQNTCYGPQCCTASAHTRTQAIRTQAIVYSQTFWAVSYK